MVATLHRLQVFLQTYIAADLAGCGDVTIDTGDADVQNVVFEIVEDTSSGTFYSLGSRVDASRHETFCP